MAIISRRDLFRFAGGAAVGTMLSPLPWKLLDDVSIWTQNWSWIPKPPKGAVSFKHTNCALCGSGCAARVRCIEGEPVSLAGVRSNAAGTGFLCPLGLVAHHLRYHPNRVTQPLVRAKDGELKPCSLDDATRVVSAKLQQLAQQTHTGRGYLAVLGNRPDTAGSDALRTLLARFPRAAYVTCPSDADGVSVLGSMVEGDQTWALDIANSKTVLSFGAPLLEGWGTSARMLAQFAGSDRKIRLIQVEPNCSLTARSADVWLPIQPGSEAALALGLANVLIEEKLIDPSLSSPDLEADSPYRKLVAEFSSEQVARFTGLQPEIITQTARRIAREAPSLVVSRGYVSGPVSHAEEMAIQALNLLLGNLDRPGGVLARPTRVQSQITSVTADSQLGTEVQRSLAGIPDGSVELMIVDASSGSRPLPWAAIRPKLVPDQAVVVVLAGLPTPWTKRADVVVPSPVFGEAIEEVPGNIDDTGNSLRLCARLVEPRPGLFQLLDFVNHSVVAAGLVTSPVSYEDATKQKVAQIHQAGVGTAVSPADGRVKALKEFSSSDDLWTALTGGARWESGPPEAAKPVTRRFSLAGPDSGDLERMRQAAARRSRLANAATSEFPLMVVSTEGRIYDSKVSALLAKVTWESGLHAEHRCVINPATAAKQHLMTGMTFTLRTPSGSMSVPVTLSEEVMPGVLLLEDPTGEDQSGVMTGPDATCRVMPGRLEVA